MKQTTQDNPALRSPLYFPLSDVFGRNIYIVDEKYVEKNQSQIEERRLKTLGKTLSQKVGNRNIMQSKWQLLCCISQGNVTG